MAKHMVLSTDEIDAAGRDGDEDDFKGGGRDGDEDDFKGGGRDGDEDDFKGGGRDGDEDDFKGGGRGAMDVFRQAVERAGSLGGFLVFAFVSPVAGGGQGAQPRASAAERVRKTQVASRSRQRPPRRTTRKRSRAKR